jgi:DNA-binding NtrC family response regulator
MSLTSGGASVPASGALVGASRVDAIDEWLDTVDGTCTRTLDLAVGRRRARDTIEGLTARAQAHGLLVLAIGSGSVRPTPGRSVLAVRVPHRHGAEDEALAWLALGAAGIRLAAVVHCARKDTVARGLRAGAREGRGTGAGHRGRLREADARARAVERQAWRWLRSGRNTRARTGFRRALTEWLRVGHARAATRAALALGALSVSTGQLVQAEALAECGWRAARMSARHRWTAGRLLRRVRDARATAHVGGRDTRERCAGDSGHGRAVRVEGDMTSGGNAVVEELMEVVQACHDVDEAPAIARVCSVVRERLSAAAVGVLAAGQTQPVAGAGRVPYASVALSVRALGASEPLEPAPGEDGLEAAVPVRFGAAPIGAICCRWPLGSTPDPGRARALLRAAAATCAPSLRAWLERERVSTGEPVGDFGIIGTSDAVTRVREAIRRAAVVPFPVLIEGESGTGKELVARAIHQASARRRRRFCAVNCAAVSDELFEAELFGHARGAFTGAVGERPGLFEDADGGTLLLDEIGELSSRGQAKLLRVLQEGEVRRVGENVCRRVDVRIVSASNRSLTREAAAERFRDDLRFRLDVIRIALPPLRDRCEDIPALVDHYWRAAVGRTGGRALLDEATVTLLTRYAWPGNVRELQNLMATLAVRAPVRGRVPVSDLPLHVNTAPPEPTTLETARRRFDQRYVNEALARCGGQRTEAARQLGLTRQGLSKLMVRLAIPRQAASLFESRDCK